MAGRIEWRVWCEKHGQFTFADEEQARGYVGRINRRDGHPCSGDNLRVEFRIMPDPPEWKDAG